jgi:hypothetical protein
LDVLRPRPERHLHAFRPRGSDQAAGARQVRSLPLAAGSRIDRVGAVRAIAGNAWRPDLAERLRSTRAAEGARYGGTVDGVIDGAPHPNVIERCEARVEEDEEHRPGCRVQVQLEAVARLDFLEHRGGNAEGEVGPPAFDCLDRVFAPEAKPELDLIGESVGTRDL